MDHQGCQRLALSFFAVALVCLPIVASAKNSHVQIKGPGLAPGAKPAGATLSRDALRNCVEAQQRIRRFAIEERLKGSGIEWTILRPGTFASNVLSWLDRKNNAIFLPVGDGRDSFVDPRDIAAVAVALLTLPGQDGRIYEISGSEWLSFAQVAQKISELTGKQASYHNIPEETAKQGMLAMGMPLPLVESMLSYYVAGIRNGKMYAPTSTIRDVLGRPARSFDEWVRDHRAMLA